MKKNETYNFYKFLEVYISNKLKITQKLYF